MKKMRKKKAGQERIETEKVLFPVQFQTSQGHRPSWSLSTLHTNVLGAHLAHSVETGGWEGTQHLGCSEQSCYLVTHKPNLNKNLFNEVKPARCPPEHTSGRVGLSL